MSDLQNRISGHQERRREEKRYCLCTHESHKALLEIIRESELPKYQKAEGGYTVLGTFDSRQEALHRGESLLLSMSRKDSSLRNASQLAARCWDDPADDSDVLPDETSEPIRVLSNLGEMP